MGSKDRGQKETKKPKKDSKKALSTNIQAPPPVVEVIRRGKKEKFDE